MNYRAGRMAVSAVPGSGKTLTLALLAAELVAQGLVDAPRGQQVLTVTYLNSSVDTFRARIVQKLGEKDLPPEGFDVRTIHSLALEIVRLAGEQAGWQADIPGVADEGQSSRYLAMAVDAWIENNHGLWRSFLMDDSPQLRVRWRDATERTARSFIRTAKNERYRPAQIADRINSPHRQRGLPGPNQLADLGGPFALASVMSGIYRRYQSILEQQGVLDFDDLIWLAMDNLERQHGLVEALRQRWPYVLEDEAQDSLPLQEELLAALTGPEGNWVRVGDPNQAITSTFTSSHPRYFMRFLTSDEVVSRPLPNSGRSAPLILNAANTLLDWAAKHHPVSEVRDNAFHYQLIEPSPPGDSQPNPPDGEAWMAIRVYRRREDEELPQVARLAVSYTDAQPEQTVAILVPTNELGHLVADHLDELGAHYDDLLRGGGRQREIASALQTLVELLADPQNTRALADSFATLHEIGHAAAFGFEQDLGRIVTLLRSVHRPETLFFPADDDSAARALPAGVAQEHELRQILRLAEFLAKAMALRFLPPDDLLLALGDLVFLDRNGRSDGYESSLSVVYQLAYTVRSALELQPDWRLPEIAAVLAEVAEGRRTLPGTAGNGYGYEPVPGRISLATQHGSKGMEWDAVYLVGLDGFWIPNTLEATFIGARDLMGEDPAAESIAQLRYLMAGDAGLFPGRTATETAHIEIICERLRLLYVGITRSRRYLHLSRSRSTRRYGREFDAEPSTALGVLYRYLVGRQETS
jgi:DNA helicase II / ATP-dependent DNA helicase PcrA